MSSNEYIDFEDTGTYHYVKVVKDDRQDDGPRDWSNFGIMACIKHRNYSLGDKEHTFNDVDEFLRGLAQEIDPKFEDIIDYWENGNGWQRAQSAHPGNFIAAGKTADAAIRKAMWEVLDKGVILPLYLYDHSGISMNTSGFACPWDSGQVGYIYATPEMIRKEYGGKITTKAIREKATKLLRDEVETYDQYLTEDVWGAVVEDIYGEEVDSLWGFYGSDYAKEEAKSLLANADTKGRAKFVDDTFTAMRRHEVDLRKQYKLLRDNCADISPITLAKLLEDAKRIQRERMELRNDAVSDHFAEED